MTPPTSDLAGEWVDVAGAAELCGIQPSTWRTYVARGQAPAPDDPDESAPPERRRPRWRRTTVEGWHAQRPGPGRHGPRSTPS